MPHSANKDMDFLADMIAYAEFAIQYARSGDMESASTLLAAVHERLNTVYGPTFQELVSRKMYEFANKYKSDQPLMHTHARLTQN